MTTTEFFVPGLPAPKGSTRAFLNRYTGRVAVVADNRATQKAWQSSVTTIARIYYKEPVRTAVKVGLVFDMPRPKSLPKRVVDHLKKPDLDKLTRCVLDGLTGVVYVDDSQVNGFLGIAKRYATPGLGPGCKITVWA